MSSQSTERGVDSAGLSAGRGRLPSAPRPAALQTERSEVLPAAVRGPVNPHEVKGGTIIPAVLLTGINSNLPGQLIAQVREPVFDHQRGCAAESNSGLRAGLRRALCRQRPRSRRGAGTRPDLGRTDPGGVNVAPTIEIRPGYAFNVMVTQDLVFPGPYDDAVCP